MVDLAEPVLYALWRQADDEGRHLVVAEDALGHALAEMGQGHGLHAELRPHGAGHVQVVFV